MLRPRSLVESTQLERAEEQSATAFDRRRCAGCGKTVQRGHYGACRKYKNFRSAKSRAKQRSFDKRARPAVESKSS
jgi:hypothetical protein